jgi:SNF2 family DNA or RNA helicase
MMVVAPVRPAELVWPAEVAKWKDFSHLRVCVLRGHKRERLFAEDADIYVANWESLEWLAREGTAAGFAWPEMWVLDESTYAKHHNNNRFSALVGRSQKKKGVTKTWPYPPMLNHAHRIVELTGTPAPNSYIDLWAQMYLLDRGASLGTYITHFRREWCWQNPRQPNQFEFLTERKDLLFDRIKHLVCRMSRNDWRDVPEPVVADVEIELPPKAREVYTKLEKDFAVEFKKAKWAIAGNAAALLTKLRQVASGGIYYEKSVEWSELVTERATEHLHDAKLDALEELVEELSGQPLLVFYGYKMEIERIRKRFGKDVPNLSGVLGKEAVALIERWNTGKIPLLLAHPKSAGHGLNLQEGGAHHCAWYTLPYDLELYDQANARLDRGEQDEQVVIHRLIAKKTVDEVVAGVLAKKHRNQQNLLDAMREGT